jgi:hypothetical protein
MARRTERGCASPILRPGKIIDVSSAAGDATRDASGRPDGHCDPIGSVDAQRPAARNSCFAPSVSRTDAFESALSAIGPSAVADWPQWRSALVLVQPATVECWHRDPGARRWWRHSRRPGRPRIDAQSRDLIGRLAEENCLWGAPRIHGELLKLGVVVSERTVSRYLRERPNRPSQTWRTFLANHLAQFTLTYRILPPYGPDADDADVSCLPSRPTRLSRDVLYAALHHAAVDRCDSGQGTSSGRYPIQDRVDAAAIRNRTGRGPPTQGGLRSTRPRVHVQKNDRFSPLYLCAEPAVRPSVAPPGSTSLGTRHQKAQRPLFSD